MNYKFLIYFSLKVIKVKKIADHEYLEIFSIKNSFKLNHNVYIVAFGKAACGMSRAAETVLSNHLVKGIASIPVGSLEILKKNKLWYFICHFLIQR